MSIEGDAGYMGTDYENAYNEALRVKTEKELHKIHETDPAAANK